MGFRTGAYLTIWTEPEAISPTMAKARASRSYKNKQTGQYEEDFKGYVTFNGTDTVQKAMQLKPKDRIKLGDVDVKNKFDKEKNKEYWDLRVWSFEMANSTNQPAHNEPQPEVDSGEISDDHLPF